MARPTDLTDRPNANPLTRSQGLGGFSPSVQGGMFVLASLFTSLHQACGGYVRKRPCLCASRAPSFHAARIPHCADKGWGAENAEAACAHMRAITTASPSNVTPRKRTSKPQSSLMQHQRAHPVTVQASRSPSSPASDRQMAVQASPSRASPRSKPRRAVLRSPNLNAIPVAIAASSISGVFCFDLFVS